MRWFSQRFVGFHPTARGFVHPQSTMSFDLGPVTTGTHAHEHQKDGPAGGQNRGGGDSAPKKNIFRGMFLALCVSQVSQECPFTSFWGRVPLLK